MSNKVNIKEIKTELRYELKEKRRQMTYSQKTEKDREILTTFLSTKQYYQSELILTYVSTEIEVDTIAIMKHALAAKKRVAVPKCIKNSSEMDFYEITSLDDLEIGSFGLLEPNINKCKKLKDSNNSNGLCITPGLSFDMRGYRLGYGMGYYDRFLKDYSSITVGLCYYDFIKMILPNGRYDVNVKMLITEKFVSRFLL